MTEPSRAATGPLRKIVRFAISGGLAAGVDFAVLSLVIHLGVSPYLARLISAAFAIVFTWGFNRTVTFATASPPSWREFIHYVGVSLAGLALNVAIYSAALWAGAPVWLAFVLGTGTAAVFNFWRYQKLLAR